MIPDHVFKNNCMVTMQLFLFLGILPERIPVLDAFILNIFFYF